MPWILLGMAASPAVAQQVTVTLGSGSTVPGGTVSLGVSLTASGGAQPSSLQFAMNYPSSDVTSVTVTAGSSTSAASKGVSCSNKAGSTVCVVWGMNANVIGNGILATATFHLASGITSTAEPVQVTNVVASSAGGTGIPASGVGSTIVVGQSTTTWSISGTISGGSGATVTLSGAASANVTADGSGNFIFNNLANSSYTVTPSQSGYTFSPTSMTVTMNGVNIIGVNFTGTSTPQPCHGKHCWGASASPDVSAAKGWSGSDVCSPGGLATLFGDSFTTQNPQKASSFPLPTQLAGVRVMVNGAPAPLLFASDSQINFQCPLVPPDSPLEATVQSENGVSTSLGQSVMQAAVPGLFTSDGASQGVVLIAATNEIAMPKTDGTPSRPAQKGEFVTIYASGLGEVVDGIPTGTQAPLDRPVLAKNKITVVVGGVEIEPAFAGLAPDTAGLFQVNAQLPEDVPIGSAIPLYIRVTLADGKAIASNTVNMAIDDRPSQ